MPALNNNTKYNKEEAIFDEVLKSDKVRKKFIEISKAIKNNEK